MNQSSPNPRCTNCRSVLIKGNAIEVLARIECEKCGHVNVIAIRKPAAAAIK